MLGFGGGEGLTTQPTTLWVPLFHSTTSCSGIVRKFDLIASQKEKREEVVKGRVGVNTETAANTKEKYLIK